MCEMRLNEGYYLLFRGPVLITSLRVGYACVVSWFAFVVAILMAHENGDKQRTTKRRPVQGMLDETDPVKVTSIHL